MACIEFFCKEHYLTLKHISTSPNAQVNTHRSVVLCMLCMYIHVVFFIICGTEPPEIQLPNVNVFTSQVPAGIRNIREDTAGCSIGGISNC